VLREVRAMSVKDSSLLSSIPVDLNPSIGLGVIDQSTWDRLAKPVRLPPTARRDLELIILEERAAWRRTKHKRQTSAQAAKELKRVHCLAEKLTSAFQEMGTLACDAIIAARAQESDVQQLTLIQRYDERFLEPDLAAVERWSRRLDRAAEIAGASPPSTKAGLRILTDRLDTLLLKHTGRGLIRSSYTKRDSQSRAGALLEFVSTIAEMTVGHREPDAIDDAIKDTITRRRRNGVSRLKNSR
jgi:hypothetical protein